MFRRFASASAAALLISTAMPVSAFTLKPDQPAQAPVQTPPAQTPPAAAQTPPTAAARVPVPPGALAFENLVFKGKMFEISIPQIVVEGSTNTKADFEALFDATSSVPLSQRLAKIDARSITIPTINVIQNTAGTKQQTVYQNNVMRDIRSGVVGEATTATLTAKGDASPIKLEITSSGMMLKGTDLPLLAQYLLEKGDINQPLKVAMVEQIIGKIEYKIDGVGAFSVAGGRMDNLKLRPLSVPLLDTVLKMQDGAKSEAEKKEAAKFASEMLTSFSIGNFEMNGLTGEGKDAKGQTNKIALNKMTMAGGSDFSGRFSLLGFSFDNPEAKIGIGDFTIDGVSMAPAMSALNKALETANFDTVDPAALVPKIDLLRIAGITANVTEKGKDPVKFGLGNFEYKMSNHVGSIPANNAMVLDKFQMEIPPMSTDEGLKTLLRLGYKTIDLSARFTQTWEEATKAMKIRDFNVTAANMFSATMNADINDVAKEIFSGDKAKSAVALLGVNAKSLSLNVVNSGIFEKAIEDQAKQQKAKPEDLRAQIAAGASLMIPMFMGDHPASKMLADAVGKFMASPKNLQITATAEGNGIGATDFIASGNPMELLKKIDIKATANQ